MKSYPYRCPCCGKKHRTRNDAMNCADLDTKELIRFVEKLDDGPKLKLIRRYCKN